MQREIMTSIPFLSQPSVETENTEADLAVAQDLKDTLDAHRNGCVGMAANMIGVSKRIIAFVDEDFGGRIFVMFNPTITAKDGPTMPPKAVCPSKASAARSASSALRSRMRIASSASAMPRSLVSPRKSSSMKSIIAKALSFNDFFRHGT